MTEVASSAQTPWTEEFRVKQLVKEAGPRAVAWAAKCLLCLRQGEAGILLETSQLRGFLEAAIACQDSRSLATWVLYQMGRQEGWRAQPKGQSDPDSMFGHQVVNTFRHVNSPLVSDLDEGPLRDRIARERVQVFAGQLGRLHSYVKRLGDEAKDGEKRAVGDATWKSIEFLAKGAV